jgi:hypothetical protein
MELDFINYLKIWYYSNNIIFRMSNLKEVLESFDVYVSSKGNVCLNDIVENIIKSKNSDAYMKAVKDKFEYKNKYYVTSDTCMDILKKGKSKTCKKVFEKIKVDGSEELKKLELKYKLSENYKLEIERDIKEYDAKLKEVETRRLDAESRLSMMQLQLELLRNNKYGDYVIDNKELEKYLVPVQTNINIVKDKNINPM